MDQTAIHPENYSAVNKLLKKMGFTSEDLGSGALNEELGKLNPAELVNVLEIGEITIKDIIDDLMKPGRDPRDELSKPLLKQDVLKMEDHANWDGITRHSEECCGFRCVCGHRC